MKLTIIVVLWYARLSAIVMAWILFGWKIGVILALIVVASILQRLVDQAHLFYQETQFIIILKDLFKQTSILDRRTRKGEKS